MGDRVLLCEPTRVPGELSKERGKRREERGKVLLRKTARLP
jgi:hypothetical protein